MLSKVKIEDKNVWEMLEIIKADGSVSENILSLHALQFIKPRLNLSIELLELIYNPKTKYELDEVQEAS